MCSEGLSLLFFRKKTCSFFERTGWANRHIYLVAIQNWISHSAERRLKTFDLWSEYEDIFRLPFIHVADCRSIISALKSELVL
jgi:hypothetical protein